MKRDYQILAKYVHELRSQGMTIKEIATTLSVSESFVYKQVNTSYVSAIKQLPNVLSKSIQQSTIRQSNQTDVVEYPLYLDREIQFAKNQIKFWVRCLLASVIFSFLPFVWIYFLAPILLLSMFSGFELAKNYRHLKIYQNEIYQLSANKFYDTKLLLE